MTCEGVKETKEFNTGLEDLINLRDWIMERHCLRVAVESTGIYWTPLYTCLEGKVETIVALARKLLSIIHHLLKNNEKYSEDELKPKKVKAPKFQSISELSLDEMIEIISRAGYTVDKTSEAS